MAFSSAKQLQWGSLVLISTAWCVGATEFITTSVYPCNHNKGKHHNHIFYMYLFFILINPYSLLLPCPQFASSHPSHSSAWQWNIYIFVNLCVCEHHPWHEWHWKKNCTRKSTIEIVNNFHILETLCPNSGVLFLYFFLNFKKRI
jgi:hypothetical protein